MLQLPVNLSSLAYPAGRTPGFDPTHIAAQGISANNGMSAVASAGSFINLLNGKAFATSGSPTATLLGGIGRAVSFPNSGGADVCSLAGQSTASISKITYGVILQMSLVQFTTYQSFLSMGTNTNAAGFATGTGELFFYNSGFATSTFVPSAGIPYFIAISISSTVCNFIVVNLKTGAVFNQSITQTNTIGTPSGTFYIGNNAGAQDVGGSIAAAMYAPSFMPMPALLQWAADPWSFWYPSQNDLILAYG